MILVDSSVLIDVIGGSPWKQWSEEQIDAALEQGPVGINQIIYGEISGLFAATAPLDSELEFMGIERFDLPFEAAFEAARALKVSRSRGGARTTMLPDFLIGAHANVAGLTLLTRDPRRVRSYFPDVALIAPE